MIKKLIPIILLTLMTSCSLFFSGKDSYERQLELSENLQNQNEHNHVPGEHPLENIEITSEDFEWLVYELSGDKYLGRGIGQEGGVNSSKQILDWFEYFHLTESWLEEFEVLRGTKNVESELEYDSESEEQISFEKEIDFSPIDYTADGDVEGKAWFLGYGIAENESDWNDWIDDEGNSINLEGGIAIMILGLPDVEEDHPLNLRENRRLGMLRVKTQVAKEHGASAVLFIYLGSDNPGGLINVGGTIRWGASPIPIGLITSETYSKIFDDSIADWGKTRGENLKSIKKTSEKTLAFSTEVELDYVTAFNVIGYLDSGKDKTFVIGGHKDHMGTNSSGEVYWGADDNASGTSGVLELANYYSHMPPEERPGNFYFMLFDAEESGLLGSRYFTNNNPEIMEEIDFMLNLDMIGRYSDNEKILMGGINSSELFESDEFWSKLTGLNQNLNFEKSTFGDGRSDHAPFIDKGVPAMFIFTGIHDDYHTPTDTPDKVDYEGLEEIGKFSISLIDLVASSIDLNISWEEDSTPEIADEEEVMPESGWRSWFGSIPDYADSGDSGYLIGGISKASPAEKAGLQAKDRIVKINSTEIKNLEDFMYALGKYKPGETIKVTYIRENEQYEVDLKLESRESR
tara:strand:- start:717 stop:2609 length:1893 start_codon:yes stop_codon:yes gene_type:complete